MLPDRGNGGRWRLLGLSLVSMAIFTSALPADVSLPAIIGDNMVLQQKIEAPIWGFAEPGERIRVTADWLTSEITTAADKQGSWRVALRTPAAGGPHTIRIAGHNTITLKNVLIGEVWICSGQSNMEWPLYRAMNGKAEVAAANYPEIRLFDVPRTAAMSPQPNCGGNWSACTPESAKRFSAVGFFFGRELHRKLGVPIGLIGSNWGGTVAEAWTSEQTIRTMEDFRDALALVIKERKQPGSIEKALENALKRWWEALERADPGSRPDGWMRPDYDDSDWKATRVPSAWKSGDLKDFDGVAWFRTEIDLPADWADKDLALELGPINDHDTTWFNGQKVGSLQRPGHWKTVRKYTVPRTAVRPGRNVIAIRVCDIAGQGGIYGKPEALKLYPVDRGPEAALPLAGQWRYRASVSMKNLPPWPTSRFNRKNLPTVLYNGMIAPLIPYGIRGVIWYQGESNRTRPRLYRTLFPRMIGDWRAHWGCGDFPFYYTQIAPFGYHDDTGQAAELREAQMLALATKNTGMAVTMDIGNPKNIHPTNKQEVGRRLSLWALAKTYGRRDIVYSGPLYRSMKIEDGAIRVFFDYVDGGLEAGGEKLTHFSIAGDDRVFHPAQAVIDGDTVVVRSPAVPAPVAVRYAWGAADEPNLRNRAGLPASSFRTDDWPREPASAIKPQPQPRAEHAVRSPDGRNVLTITQYETGVRYAVMRGDAEIIAATPISITIDGRELPGAAAIEKVTRRVVDETIEPVVPTIGSKLRDHFSEMRLVFAGGVALCCRAYNDGVAFRWESTIDRPDIIVDREDLAFRFRDDLTVYFPVTTKQEDFFSHQECRYDPCPLSRTGKLEPGPAPALVELSGGDYLLISDVNVAGYPGLWLKGNDSTTLSAVFPRYPAETRVEKDRHGRSFNDKVIRRAPYLAKTAGRRTYPWRAFVLADAAGLLTSTMLYHLAEPGRLKDVSWIKPGKVAWDWWNARNIAGVPFRAGVNQATYKHYIDFAAEMGIAYIILDEGWSVPGPENLLKVVPEIDMPELVAYGRQRQVGVILWMTSVSLEANFATAFRQFESWGVAGLKIDFMQRDDQVMMDFLYRAAEEAARHRLVVDFHGGSKPAGITRTFPNVLTIESVMGLEQAKWGKNANPDMAVLLPFTRMVVGPMDYTPGAMVNLQKKNFRPIFNRPASMGTRAQQLAMYVVYLSPLQMLADSPTHYRAHPDCLPFLRDVPVTWDETRVLAAKVGSHVVVARRHGDTWYLGAMTNWSARDLSVPLDFLGAGDYQMTAWADGINADRYGSDVRVTRRPVTADSKLEIRMAPGGGLAAILEKCE